MVLFILLYFLFLMVMNVLKILIWFCSVVVIFEFSCIIWLILIIIVFKLVMVVVLNIDLDIFLMKDNGVFFCFFVLFENELRVLEINDKNFEIL